MAKDIIIIIHWQCFQALLGTPSSQLPSPNWQGPNHSMGLCHLTEVCRHTVLTGCPWPVNGGCPPPLTLYNILPNPCCPFILHVHITSAYFTSTLSSLFYSLYMSTPPQPTSPHHSLVSSTHTLHVHTTSAYFTSSLSSLFYSYSISKCLSTTLDHLSLGDGPHIHLTILISTLSILMSWLDLKAHVSTHTTDNF